MATSSLHRLPSPGEAVFITIFFVGLVRIITFALSMVAELITTPLSPLWIQYCVPALVVGVAVGVVAGVWIADRGARGQEVKRGDD